MLFECHGHIVLDGHDWKSALLRHKNTPDRDHIACILQRYISGGITHYRDGGDNLGVSALAKSMAKDAGIDFRTPCFAIHRNGRYGKMVGRGYDSISEYRALISELRGQRADFVKLMLSGIISYTEYGIVTGGGPDADEIKELIHIAHSEGFTVMCHANTPEAVIPALESGADSIEHGFFINDECIAAMAETGAIWVPTLATAVVLDGISSDKYNAEVVGQIIGSHSANIRRAAASGVLIACGSDAGAHLLPHGKAAEKERQSLCTAIGDNADMIIDRSSKAVFNRFKSDF